MSLTWFVRKLVLKLRTFHPGRWHPTYQFRNMIDGMAKLFKINQPISPVRIRKLVCSNYIVPAYLKKHGYPYQYTFHQALEDWKNNQPGDWIISRKKAQ